MEKKMATTNQDYYTNLRNAHKCYIIAVAKRLRHEYPNISFDKMAHILGINDVTLREWLIKDAKGVSEKTRI